MAIKTSFNHLQIYVADRKVSFPFYKELLTYLGYEVIDDDGVHLGMSNGFMDIWLREVSEEFQANGYHRKNVGVNHFAFSVSEKEDVDKFYREFLVPREIKVLYGSPKLFPEYSEKYYAVFFEDPDRIKLEVVFL